MKIPFAGAFARIAQVLGLNGVPIAGILGEGWSQGTAIAIYWVESVLVILLVSARIVLHRRWTRKRGHFHVPAFQQSGGDSQDSTTVGPGGASRGRRGNVRRKAQGARTGTLLSSYLGVAIPFTFVHGIFLALLLFLMLPQQFGPEAGVSMENFRTGCLGVLAFLVAGFLIDLVRLRDKSFRWMEVVTERAQGRIFVVHMTILGGMFAMAFFEAPAALFLVFAGLKTLFDFGGAFPHRELSQEPPKWSKWLDRVKPGGESFSDFWRRTEAAQQRRREQNEQTLDPH